MGQDGVSAGRQSSCVGAQMTRTERIAQVEAARVEQIRAYLDEQAQQAAVRKVLAAKRKREATAPRAYPH